MIHWTKFYEILLQKFQINSIRKVPFFLNRRELKWGLSHRLLYVSDFISRCNPGTISGAKNVSKDVVKKSKARDIHTACYASLDVLREG
jgi:hypothetical protein